MQGLILFAHGARDPRWAIPFEAVAQRVRALRPGVQVRLAYLEFMSPNLPHAADDLVSSGCTRVDVLPLFLGSGGHVRRDLPELVTELERRHAGTAFKLHEAAGEHPDVSDALAQHAVRQLGA